MQNLGGIYLLNYSWKDQKQLPTRSIQTPQELLLLDRITEAYGKPEQRLGYLQSSQLGSESAVAKGEWQLWRTRLQLMEAAKQWQELFDTTGTLLKRARTKDESSQLPESRLSDWIVWEAYIRSAVELGSSQYVGPSFPCFSYRLNLFKVHVSSPG
jgi:N-terminal acetyltransferase B complex non-catalytic subunit